MTDPVAQEIRSAVKVTWWLVLLRGIFAVIFGVLVLAWPAATALAIIVIYGIFAIADGLIEIALGFGLAGRPERRGLLFLQGVLSIVAGVIALVWPGITAVVALYLIAIYAIVIGLVELAGSFQLRREGIKRWWYHLISGALVVILGLILFIGHPVRGILALLWVLGILAIVSGVSLIAGAFIARKDLRELDRSIGRHAG